MAVILSAFLLGASFSASAIVLDDFNSASLSGWTTTLNGGTFVQSAGQLTVTPVAFANALTYGKKTTLTFTNLATHTLEFRVLVNGILTNSATTNGLAVLGWVPTGGALGANGYALGVGPRGAAMLFNASFVYVTNFATPLPTNDMYLALRLTPEGANMIVKSTVYRKADGRFNVLFEHTLTNTTTTLIGTGGNAILGAFNDTSGVATSASFDDLVAYDTVREVLDDFSGPYPAGWQDHVSGVATNYNNGSGQLKTDGGNQANQVSGTFKADRTFKITDGVRLEFRVDVVDAAAQGAANYTILAYAPHGDNDFNALSSYHLSFSALEVYAGKAYGGWWEAGYDLFAPQTNVRMIQSFTGEGTSVRIESRIEDLSVDVNDPARVVYQTTKVDSTSAYQNFDGFFQLGIFSAATLQGSVVWDNAEVNKPAGGNTPPVITGLSPANGKNFLNAAAGVSFNVTDDIGVPLDKVKLILNGIAYTNGSPGVTITPTSASSINRSFAFTNLSPDVFYVGSIEVSDNLGAMTMAHYEFDTFLTNHLQIEAEDFNYSTNPGVDGGLFLDGGLNAYAGFQGSQDIDYHDSRTSGNNDNPIPYRPSDYARQYLTGDGPRAKYVAVSQPEYLVYDNNNGDWRNYTRTFTAGTYKVYSRQSTFSISRPLVTLDRVTSDPHSGNQTSSGLGAFLQLGDSAGDTGYDLHRNVPLTDAFGNPTVVRFAGGVDTVRVTDRYVDDSEDGDVFHNYLVFVPTTDPGTLRPIVTQTAPIAGDTFRQAPATEATFASIANRDTAVDTNTIVLQINGSTVTPALTNTAGGVDVAWSFAALPNNRVITNTLIFADNLGVYQTNTWSYSYPFLSASNRLGGILATRGFDVRMVQADFLTDDDTINRAEQQLAIPPAIPYDRTWRTNVNTLAWNDNTGAPNYVPGLDGGISGYNPGPYNNIATESLAYLQLTAGPHRFRVDSDDGFEVRSGANLADTSAAVMGFQNGTFGGTFDFIVEADGLYPVRCLWYEGGGDAHFSLRSVNLGDSATVLVNDPADPTGVIKAYLPGIATAVLSAASIGGPYSARADAVINTATKTVTVPISGSAQFYRMSSSSAVTLKTITVEGGNVIITYQ